MAENADDSALGAPAPVVDTANTGPGGDGRGPIEKVATCPHCGKSFFGRRDAGVLSNYHRHVRSHTDERPYICQVCAVAFKTPSNLKRHFRRLHEESTTEASSGEEEHRGTAPLLDEEGNPVEWFKANHRKGRRGKPLFRCDECVKVYNSKWSLSEHQRKVHSGESDEVECDACGAVLSSMAKLRRHKQQSCIFRDFSDADDEEEEVQDESATASRNRNGRLSSENRKAASGEQDPVECMVVAATTTAWEADGPLDEVPCSGVLGVASPVAVAPPQGAFPAVVLGTPFHSHSPSEVRVGCEESDPLLKKESRKRRRLAPADEMDASAIHLSMPDSADTHRSSRRGNGRGRSTAKSRSVREPSKDQRGGWTWTTGTAVNVCTESADCEAFFRSRKALAAHIKRRHSS